MAAKRYSFGRIDIHAATREVRGSGALVDLPARAFDCLVYLIEHRDRAVGRDELIAAVWGRADVSEALLNHTILKIRRSLGGDGARAIRTVPRFGYRWVGTIVEDEADRDEPAPELPSIPEKRAANATRSPRRAFTLAAVLFAAAAALAIVWHYTAQREIETPKPADVVAESTPAQPALPALVLPAEIDAPEDWRWLRFGIMDLVANRLRSGSLVTVPSESVVALLKQRAAAGGDALLADPSLAQFAALRVLPRVRFDGSRWRVTLDASGMQQALAVEADAADPIGAARDASSRLIAKLGLTPNATAGAESTPALDELLQRSGAAMLADQLAQARTLIEAAPAALRDAPRLQQRMAQIELRAGEYDAVEKRLAALIDRLDPHRDAALRARALITLASSYVRRNRFDKADEAYAEAIALRSEAKDPEALGIAYLGRGVVLATRGRFDEASADLGRARIELETAGDPLGVAQVDVNLGDFQVMRHRPADGLPILKTAAERFEQLGAREGRVYALVAVAAVERALLDPAAALATTEHFWPPESNTSNPRMQWIAVRARIEALAANGRLRDASTLVARVGAESDPQRDAAVRVAVEAIAAAIAAARGDFTEAARRADAAATPALLDDDKALYAQTLLLGARASRRIGDVARASAATERLRALAASAEDEAIVLVAAIAEAEEALASNRRDAALQGFAGALQRAAKVNVPDDLVAAGAPYVDALIDASHLDEARAVAGRLAPFADRDVRAAWAEVRLYRALDRPDAEHNAMAVAVRIAGDGTLPDAPEIGSEAASAAR